MKPRPRQRFRASYRESQVPRVESAAFGPCGSPSVRLKEHQQENHFGGPRKDTASQSNPACRLWPLVTRTGKSVFRFPSSSSTYLGCARPSHGQAPSHKSQRMQRMPRGKAGRKAKSQVTRKSMLVAAQPLVGHHIIWRGHEVWAHRIHHLIHDLRRPTECGRPSVPVSEHALMCTSIFKRKSRTYLSRCVWHGAMGP